LITRLFLVRHGETEPNRRGLALGRADVPLNDTGRSQAKRLAFALSRKPLVAVYSSPLSRTVETARSIASAHGLAVQIEPGLIEMDIGELDGLTFSEVRARYPGLLEAWVGSEGPAHSMPGGESLVDVQERAVAAVRSLAGHDTGESVCLVTHNFVLLSLLAEILGIDLSGFRRLRHAVAGITTVEVNGETRRLLRYNDTCHLAPPG
jgi:broad specificity phosphatase PhoE